MPPLRRGYLQGLASRPPLEHELPTNRPEAPQGQDQVSWDDNGSGHSLPSPHLCQEQRAGRTRRRVPETVRRLVLLLAHVRRHHDHALDGPSGCSDLRGESQPEEKQRFDEAVVTFIVKTIVLTAGRTRRVFVRDRPSAVSNQVLRQERFRPATLQPKK